MHELKDPLQQKHTIQWINERALFFRFHGGPNLTFQKQDFSWYGGAKWDPLILLLNFFESKTLWHCSIIACLFSMMAFEIRCIGRGLSVLDSRLKDEVYIHASLCLSSVYVFTDCFWNLVYWLGTVSSRLTLKEQGKLTRFPVFILGVYVNKHVSQCFSSTFIFVDCFWYSVH